MIADYLSVADLTADQLADVLDLADELKARRGVRDELAGRTVAMIFEKPSLRTRLSFQVAIAELGGHPLPLFDVEVRLGEREPIADAGRVLSGYVHAIVIRTFGQDRLLELAESASVPVVNALSDLEHPCQALADLQTIREQKGKLEGIALAYVGDGNNVLHSLLLAGALTGMSVRAGCPDGFAPDPDIVERAEELGGDVTITTDPVEAVEGADVVYTDVWASMGQEEEAAERRERFQDFRVDAELFGNAASDAIFLHCLPAHRGEEVATEVIDGSASRVFEQAENRLHAQKALLARMLGS